MVESESLTPSLTECLVKCLVGSVSVGQYLQLAGPNHIDGYFEVLEIRYFNRLIAELETNFGGQLLLRTEGGSPTPSPDDELIGLEVDDVHS